MNREQRKRLPKARLVAFEWAKPVFSSRAWFSKHRLANALRLRVGNLVVIVRAPWLEDSARALHPNLFA